ncbi:UNVERIFIED_CONTAM: hypothetical protein GTU68_059357 [Idotea baltica]|nr:hypothetical protein [Idotea baltica]
MFSVRFPSLSTIVLSVFVTYLLYSLWTMIQLFIPPTCTSQKNCLRPILEDNPKFQVLAYSSIKKFPQYNSEASLIHSEKYFDYENLWEKNFNIDLPLKVRSNGTMFLHLFLTSPKVDPKKWSNVLDEPLSVYASVPLTRFQVPDAKSFNLLGESDAEKAKSSPSKARPVSHFASQIVFNVLTQPILFPGIMSQRDRTFLKAVSEGEVSAHTLHRQVKPPGQRPRRNHSRVSRGKLHS